MVASKDLIMRIRVEQGSLPSCQTLSAIIALGLTDGGYKHLCEMIAKTETGFLVRFPDGLEIRVSAAETVPQLVSAVAGDIDEPPRTICADGDETARVLEIAYARYLHKRDADEFESRIPDSAVWELYKDRAFHYRASISLDDLTGLNSTTIIADGGVVPEHSAAFAQQTDAIITDITNILFELASIRDHVAAVACTVGTPDSGRYLERGHKLVSWHDHAVKTILPQERMIGVLDPYNSEIEILMPFQTFFKHFNLVSFIDLRTR